MAYPHDRRTPTNLRNPQYVGFCERCGEKWYHAALSFQYEYRGPSLGNLNLLVCPQCNDRPNEQLRTIVIGPEGLPPKPRPAPNFYDQQNAAPGFTPGLAPLSDDEGDLLVDDFGNPILAG